MRHQELYDALIKAKPEDLTEFEKDLLRDWGNPDIYGPWTEQENRTDGWDPSVGFKFYKSYYMMHFSNDKKVIIDTFKP